MTYRNNIRISRYESFSNWVPYLPQVALLAAMLAALGFLSVMTVMIILDYQQEALQAVVHRHFFIPVDFSSRLLADPMGTLDVVFMTGFGRATLDLAKLLVAMAAIAFLMPWLPMFNECGRWEPKGRISGFLMAILPSTAGAAVVIFTVVFCIWCVVAGVPILLVSFVPLLVNPLAVIPAMLMIALTHFYVGLKLFSLWPK